eukprot:Polyplicarium_translucidae@DN2863_c0_g1_i1.p1
MLQDPTARFDSALAAASVEAQAAGAVERPSWVPYQDNGGTVVAAAGHNYAVAVCDTRLSAGFRIHTRNATKIARLTDKVAICSAGMRADITTLQKVLRTRIALYEHDHRASPSVEAVAALLSTILYSRRFFPYYTFNVLVGLDKRGVGATYQYDAIGCVERVEYAAAGSGSSLVLSILDNQLAKTNQTVQALPPEKLECIDLLKDVMTSVTERDINTGDGAEVLVVDASGISVTKFALKQD